MAPARYATGIVTMQAFALAFLLVVFEALRNGWFFIFIDLDNQVVDVLHHVLR